jgi:hypothetical protein
MKSLAPPVSLTKPIPLAAIAKWESGAGVTAFKEEFAEWAIANQHRRCAYCCLPVGVIDERRPHSLDHIAPKGDRFYPQFTFERFNIVVACSACNERLKNRSDTVSVIAANYAQCVFNIVHPYFDNVDDHINGSYLGGASEVSVPQALSSRGAKTVELFALDDPGYLKVANKEAVAIQLDHAQSALPKPLLQRLKAALAELRGR